MNSKQEKEATVKSAYKEPTYYKDFHSLIFTKGLVHYTFIRNFSYKEQIFMVLMSSL